MNGIDVSHVQGTIDWPTVAGAGVGFAFAKATEGTTFTDSKFAANWFGMKAAGIARGAYHFFHPAMDAAAQAAHFLAVLASANGGSAQLAPGDLPPVIDLEWVKDAMPAPTEYAADVQAFLDAVEAGTGRAPMIYTDASFWNEFAASDAFGRYPLWVAEYGAHAPKLPAGWDQYTIWQNSSNGKAAGIATPVDLDVFNGSPEEMQQLAGMKAPGQ